MSDIKATCPACDSTTSSIGMAFREGKQCPVCKLPALAALEIEAARTRGADTKLTERLAKLEIELAATRERAGLAEYKLEQIQGALDGRA